MAKWEIIEDTKFKKQTGGKAAASRAIAPKKTAAEAATNAAYATTVDAADDRRDLVLNSLQNVASDADNAFWTKYDKSNETNSYVNDTNKIKLNTGRFTGANVPSTLIDDLASAANKNNIPVGQMLALAGRESTFGIPTKYSNYANKAEYVSGWNVSDQYTPYNLYRFLADKKVPGIKTLKSTHGWGFIPEDKEKIINYTKNHPELIDEYKSKITKTLDVGDKNVYDLAAIQLKNKGIQSYNPSDPNYVKMFQKDYDSLKQDKNLMDYLQKKGYDYENVTPQESSQPVVLPTQKPGQSIALPPQFKIGGKVSDWQIIDDIPKAEKGLTIKTPFSNLTPTQPVQEKSVFKSIPTTVKPQYKSEGDYLNQVYGEDSGVQLPGQSSILRASQDAKPAYDVAKQDYASYKKDFPNQIEEEQEQKTAEQVSQFLKANPSPGGLMDKVNYIKNLSPADRQIIENSYVGTENYEGAKREYLKNLTATANNNPFSKGFWNYGNINQKAQGIGASLYVDKLGIVNDLLNVPYMMGEMTPGVVNIPYNLSEGNYGAAAMGLAGPLALAALTPGAKGFSGMANNLLNPLAGIIDANTVRGLGKKVLNNYGREAFTPMLDNVGVEALGAVNPSTLKTNPFINTVEPQTSFFSRNPSVFTNRTIPQETIDLSRREVFRRIGERQPTTRRVYTLENEEDLARFNVDNNFIPPPPSEYQSAMNLVGVNFSEAELNSMNVRDIARGLQDNINTSSNMSRIDLDALIPYKNLTYNQLVIKNPSLAEKLKNAFKGIKLNIKNVADKTAEKLTVANQKLGEIIEPIPIIDKNKFELDLQENLNKGVGIKKGGTQIQLKEEYPYNYQIHIKTPGETNFINSGEIRLSPVQKQRSFTDILLNKKKYQGLKKPYDFPLGELKENPNFNLNLPEYKGISAEIGEATKQALKNQNKKFDLLSSKSHTDEGGTRYLTEFLNGRKPAIDISGNKEWLEMATELKNSLKGKPIRKEEVKKILAGDKYGASEKEEYDAILKNKLFPKGVQFKYKEGGIIEDPRGQWAHPGSVTRIPSNQITMQGVNYPVLGVSDRGHTQMMYPGEDYSFRGRSVTEYPMMQGGGRYTDWKNKYDLQETSDYNLQRAFELGYVPDKTGHLPSVDSETGEWLKSDTHPTRGMEMMESMLNPDVANNLRLIRNEKGKMQYIPKSKYGGEVNFTYAGENHRVYEKVSPTGNGKGVEGHIMVNHPTENKGKWDTIDLTKITNGKVKTVPQGVASTKKWHKENPEYANGGQVSNWEIIEDLPKAQNGTMTYPLSVPTRTDSLNLYNNAIEIGNYFDKHPEYQILDTKKEEEERKKELKRALKEASNDYYQLFLGSAISSPDEIKKTKNFLKNARARYNSFINPLTSITEANKKAVDRFNTNSKSNTPDDRPILIRNGVETKGSILPLNEYRNDINDNQYYQREQQNGRLNLDIPMQLFDKRINPDFKKQYMNELNEDGVLLYGYNPIFVKPYDLLTLEEKIIVDQKNSTNTTTAPTTRQIQEEIILPVRKNEIDNPQISKISQPIINIPTVIPPKKDYVTIKTGSYYRNPRTGAFEPKVYKADGVTSKRLTESYFESDLTDSGSTSVFTADDPSYYSNHPDIYKIRIDSSKTWNPETKKFESKTWLENKATGESVTDPSFSTVPMTPPESATPPTYTQYGNPSPTVPVSRITTKQDEYKNGGKTSAWQRKEGKSPSGGLNDKGRASLKKEGHDIKPPQPEGGSRKDSFCARMSGMKKKLTGSKKANDPNSRINLSLKKWKC